MLSTFHGIEVGKRGLQVHQQGMHTVEHNVSNANTEGYSRQKITFETMDPLFAPGLAREHRPGQIGQGTLVQSIKRMRNAFLDDRVMQEETTLGYWKEMHSHLHQIEQIHNESSEHTIRNTLDKMWKAWEKLNQNPDDRATRAVVRETSITLAQSISKTFERLYALQSNIDTQVELKVDMINNQAKQIANLNDQILRSQAAGDDPNDLLDKRDLLVEQLSEKVNVNVVRGDPDEFMIYVGSQYLVQGKKSRALAAEGNPQKDGFVDVRWAEDGSEAKILGGEIRALLDLRDEVIAKQISQIDNMTANLSDLVNETHRNGFGLNYKTGMDFFRMIHLTDNRNGNYDYDGNGQNDRTILFKIAGTKKVNPERQIGSSGVLNFGPREPDGEDVLIQYAARDRVRDVVDRINKNKVGVVAYVNNRGRLSIKADLPESDKHMKFVIRHLEDSGDLLVGVAGLLQQRGEEGAYDWRNINQVNQLVGQEKDYTVTPQYHPSRWVGVHQFIKNDLNNIAAGQGTDTNGDDRFDTANGPGDGNNALKIAKYRYADGMIGENATFDEFFTSVIGQLGSDSRDAKTHMEKSKLVMKHLEQNRKSISGVSLDEEMADMVVFQHGYNASARLVRTFDEMLDTVINRLKV